MARNNNVTIENARIIFRNFSGKEDRYNRAGDRNFCVVLTDEVAEDLVRDGWNVNWLEPREEGDDRQAFLKVTVKFGKNPPRIMVVTERGKKSLDEDGVNLLDWAEINNVDLIIRPYDWDINGKQGRTAYLNSIYVTIEEDPLEAKYFEVPEIGVKHVEEEA
ncbi:MAG TPA: hypothetical protein PKW49_01010 [Paludibacteraceae bacterium]|nr:hypothetical protein [Paludibacteraceae bacterium]